MEGAKEIKTIFCDIDGCIFYHAGPNFHKIVPKRDLLPGVIKKFHEWMDKGYTVILTTGRPPSLKETTIKQLQEVGLWFDHIIMGLPRGPRVIINDLKKDTQQDNAIGINVKRNEGLENVNC